MNSITETDEWKLGCFFEWREKYRTIDCDSCNGTGIIGGHFKDLDGERDCPACSGLGTKRIRPTTQTPDIPADLREHMRRAWWDFFNKRNGDSHEKA